MCPLVFALGRSKSHRGGAGQEVGWGGEKVQVRFLQATCGGLRLVGWGVVVVEPLPREGHHGVTLVNPIEKFWQAPLDTSPLLLSLSLLWFHKYGSNRDFLAKKHGEHGLLHRSDTPGFTGQGTPFIDLIRRAFTGQGTPFIDLIRRASPGQGTPFTDLIRRAFTRQGTPFTNQTIDFVSLFQGRN
ncbi:hypothetical protein Btru_052475 [Bulinus truncatus]|nr:hypothetical protein Btru_052475 [Bulinus truncatus]